MNIEVNKLDWAQTSGKPEAAKRVRDASWRPKSMALRIRVFLILLTLDLICITAGFAGAAFLRGGLFVQTNWIIPVALVPAYLVIGINLNAYDARSVQDRFFAVAKGGQALTFAVCAVILVAFCLKTSSTFPRVVVTIGYVLALILMVVARYLFSSKMERIVGGNPFSVILICDGDQPIPEGRFSVMIASEAFFDPDAHDPVMYDRLSKSLESADRVVVACAPERRVTWAQALKGVNIQSEIVVPELSALSPLGVGVHGTLPTIVVAVGALDLIDRIVKRGFDIVVASLALLVLLPFMVVVAILIKGDSKGPVLFRQTRIGRGNQMFKMFKFRSMRVEKADAVGDRSTARDDDRITRVGRIIRRTSIDELPQLLNVLRGDMSIVGPRPHALGSRAADKLFWEVDGRYWHRHAAKPGLTGLAQIRGYRGATLVESDLQNRLQADLEYLDTWSIWRDLKIIVLTFQVLIHRNAF